MHAMSSEGERTFQAVRDIECSLLLGRQTGLAALWGGYERRGSPRARPSRAVRKAPYGPPIKWRF